MATNIPDY